MHLFCCTAHKKNAISPISLKKSATGSTSASVFFLYNSTFRISAISPDTPLIRKRTTGRWTLRCSHHVQTVWRKRQQFSSLKFQNVVPDAWTLIFPVLYSSNNFSAVRGGYEGVCYEYESCCYRFFRVRPARNKHWYYDTIWYIYDTSRTFRRFLGHSTQTDRLREL